MHWRENKIKNRFWCKGMSITNNSVIHFTAFPLKLEYKKAIMQKVWIKQICTYVKSTFAASWHSATRRLYPGLVVNACLRPENANNILNGFSSSGPCMSLWSIVCICQTVLLRWQFLEEKTIGSNIYVSQESIVTIIGLNLTWVSFLV